MSPLFPELRLFSGRLVCFPAAARGQFGGASRVGSCCNLRGESRPVEVSVGSLQTHTPRQPYTVQAVPNREVAELVMKTQIADLYSFTKCQSLSKSPFQKNW